MGNTHSTNTEQALVRSKFRRPVCHFRTFQTSRGMDFLEYLYEGHMVALNHDDHRRWQNIVFNHYKARFPGGAIPNASPRRHTLFEFDAEGETEWTDLDFFEDSEVLFETHPIREAWMWNDYTYRENLDFSKQPVLVLMDDKEWKAWRSAASVETIDTRDQRKLRECGSKHVELRGWDSEEKASTIVHLLELHFSPESPW